MALDLGEPGLILDERKFPARLNKIWCILHKIRVKVFHFLKIIWQLTKNVDVVPVLVN